VKRRFKWLAIAVVLALAVALIASVARDPLFWKRYALSLVYSPTNLPGSFYEPSDLVEGTDDYQPPRVQPEDEHLAAAALRSAAEYARARHTRALIVGRHGHIVFEQYWDGARFESVIDAGAFNATITALMVGLALDDKKIGLVIEPAANYIEEFRADDRNAITIKDLLGGTSGLAASEGGRGPWSAAAREHFSSDILRECLGRQVVHRHGEHPTPQACDVQLLARAVERATGQPYASYISARLWKPIGASDAFLARDSEAGTPRADCCLRARQGDWMRIAELLLNDGKFAGEQVIAPGWVTQMLATPNGAPGFGFQVWRGSSSVADAAPAQPAEPYAADDTYLLKAAGKTRLWFIPSLGLSILRVGTNRDDDADWDDARIPNLIVRGASDFVPRTAKPGSTDLSTLVPNH